MFLLDDEFVVEGLLVPNGDTWEVFSKKSSFCITLKAALELVNARLVRPIGIADFKRAQLEKNSLLLQT